MRDFDKIREICGANSLLDHPARSRVQKICYKGKTMFIKRDDELSFGISGSKYRKFLSLIPYIKNNDFSHVVTEGSEYSNNILGLAQTFREFDISFTFVLKKGHNPRSTNKLLLNLITREEEMILLDTNKWKQRHKIIKEYAKKKDDNNDKTLILPEGAFHEACLTGAMTLAFDIDLQKHQAIYIDAGTGLSFLGLALGLTLEKYRGKVYVVSLFEDYSYFENHLKKPRTLGSQKILPDIDYEIIFPKSSKSFGSFTRETRENISYFATNFGILTDPLYSGKSLPIACEHSLSNHDQQPLIIHSGGALALPGFL